MDSLVNLRQRKRKRCRKCNQDLSHSAYVRHFNPAVCPERSSPTQVEERTVAENSAENKLSRYVLQENVAHTDVHPCEFDPEGADVGSCGSEASNSSSSE